MIFSLSILICIYWCHLRTCMIFIMQEQVTITIRFSQGTCSANVMSICIGNSIISSAITDKQARVSFKNCKIARVRRTSAICGF